MSSMISEDTARTVGRGRETLGAFLRAAQTQLQKVFIVFVVGLLGTIWALRVFLWAALKENTKQRMSPELAAQVDIIARTPFDVILLQVKIGAVVGILLCIPLLLYYAKEPLKRRGFTPSVPVSRAQLAGIAALMAILFVGGVAYSYVVFFPFMFEFLAQNALNASLKPSWDITMWTQFLFLLTLSFGLAAQLPLVMSSLSYAELVPYETWRDKWKYAVVAIFGFGAVASPPDPLTQVMWGLPLCTLYAVSLALSKVVVNLRRRGESAAAADGLLRRRMLQFGGLFVGVLLACVALIRGGAIALVDAAVVPLLPASIRPGDPLASGGLDPAATWGAQFMLALQIAIVAALLVLLVYTLRVLRSPVEQRGAGRYVDPADIDLDELDEAGVRAAPPEAFAALSEEEALAHARTAMDADDPDRAQAILDRFDAVQEARSDGDDAGGTDAPGDAGSADAPSDAGDGAAETAGDASGETVAASEPANAPEADDEPGGEVALGDDEGDAESDDDDADDGPRGHPLSGIQRNQSQPPVTDVGAFKGETDDGIEDDVEPGDDEDAEDEGDDATDDDGDAGGDGAAGSVTAAAAAGATAGAAAGNDGASETGASAGGSPEDGSAGGESGGGSVVQSTAAGMVDPFTEDETTEDDIGGYFYDVRFILDSLTSKVFRLVATFMVTMAAVFFYLYQGGLGDIMDQFLSQVPPEVRGDPATMPFDESVATARGFASAVTTMPGGPTGASSAPASPTTPLDAFPYAEMLAGMSGSGQIGIVIALHPVEQLIFAVKVSVIIGAAVTLPLVLYYAWPALRERGFGGGGDRSTFLVWGVAVFAGFAVGSAIGYLVFAPFIVSYLVSDALAANMIISYRVNSFMWLIAFMTVGIGVLVDIPVTMVLFHYRDIVHYDAMLRAWRGVVLALFVVGTFVTSSGVLSMLLFAIPLTLAYLFGLGVLYVMTFPVRLVGRGGGGGSETESAA